MDVDSNREVLLKVTGAVAQPRAYTLSMLQALPAADQIEDASQLANGRSGSAVWLRAIFADVEVSPDAKFISLHSSLDDFHASVALTDLPDRGFVIYELDGEPLTRKQGGPVRFFIRDHAACQADDVDECANVKFLDHIELTTERGFDNRPQDEEAHARLHGH